MANINAGAYNMTDRNLVLEIEDDFDLSEPNCRYVLCGDNGVGKTSFLEKILIPVRFSNRLDFLYIGQDIRNQLCAGGWVKPVVLMTMEFLLPFGLN